MDHLTKEARSALMSRIRGKHTEPEMLVRRLISSLGIKYRLHVKKLPGSPDIVITRMHKVIFVNGCFWHGHYCRASSMPKSNTGFWVGKIQRNKKRDRSNVRKLQRSGWSCLTVWECDLKKTTGVNRIIKFLSG